MKKSISLNIISEILLECIKIFSMLIIPKVIIYYLGSDINGAVYSITRFIEYVVILNAGIDNVIKAAFYKPIFEKDEQKISQILKTASFVYRKFAIVIALYTCLLAFIYPLIILKDLSFSFLFSLVLVIGINFFFKFYCGVPYQILIQAERKKYIVSFLQCLSFIFHTVVSVLLLQNGFSIQITLLFSTAVFSIRPILQYLYIRRKYRYIKNTKIDRNLLSKKWTCLSHHIAYIVHENVGAVVLTVFSKSLSSLSVYSVYAMIVKALWQLVNSFSADMESIFGNMWVESQEQCRKQFSFYETIAHIINTLLFSVAGITLIPFIKIYTFGINDANYIQPMFAIVLVIMEFINCLKVPYLKIIYAKGDFNNTKKAAYAEIILSIILSVVFVNFLGMIGVALGILIGVLYRGIDTAVYISKDFLKRDIKVVFKKVVLNIACVTFASIVIIFIPFNPINYLSWCCYAFVCLLINLLFLLVGNWLVFRDDMNKLFLLLIKFIRKKD